MNSPAMTHPAPYPGLRPFEHQESDRFFGRETQINEMLIRLEDHPDFKFLAVLGASGSGKSSLVRAGLIPALERGFLLGAPAEWKFVIARPGEAPLRNLAEAWVETWHPASIPDAGSSATDATCRVPTPEDLQRRKVDVEFTLAQLRSGSLGIARAYRGDSATKDQAVLVLIDQFEELFRFRREQPGSPSRAADGSEASTADASAQEAEREQQRNESASFVELLLMTARQSDMPIYVAVTMRSDFLGDCDAFIGLPEAISRSQYLTPRMTRAQLSEAITRPTEIPEFRTTIAPELVTRILNDVGTDPDQLPLMQHALMRTWRQARGEFQIADYEQVGGVSRALNQHADEIYKKLGDEPNGARLQRVAERLFCSLSERRDGGPLTRRSITVSEAAQEVGDVAHVLTVARAFQAANLLVFSPPGQPLSPATRLDISHDSLLRQWDKLKKWIDIESKSALTYRSLTDAVHRNENRKQTDYLSDAYLAEAQEWLKQSQPNVHWAMRYDGATEAADRLFDRCGALIQSSAQARCVRLDKAQAAADREQAVLRKTAEVEAQRARDAEAAAIRFRRRTKAALAACVVAVICLAFALKNLQDAKVATAAAEKHKHVAQEAERVARTAEGNAIEAKRDAVASQDAAETQRTEANRQNAKHFWQFAILARDATDPDAVKAAQLFLRGARSLGLIVPDKQTPGDTQRIVNDGLAASAVDQPLVRSWVHTGAIIGCQLSPDDSRVLTWRMTRRRDCGT